MRLSRLCRPAHVDQSRPPCLPLQDEFQFSLLGLADLQYLHLVAPSTQALYCPLPLMLSIVKHCAPTLRQIGVQNRVRSVGRTVYKPDQATVFYEAAEIENDPTAPWYIRNGMRVSLDPWDEPLGVSPEHTIQIPGLADIEGTFSRFSVTGIWPEALLVVRT